MVTLNIMMLSINTNRPLALAAVVLLLRLDLREREKEREERISTMQCFNSIQCKAVKARMATYKNWQVSFEHQNKRWRNL